MELCGTFISLQCRGISVFSKALGTCISFLSLSANKPDKKMNNCFRKQAAASLVHSKTSSKIAMCGKNGGDIIFVLPHIGGNVHPKHWIPVAVLIEVCLCV